jgi:hypothetical protein
VKIHSKFPRNGLPFSAAKFGLTDIGWENETETILFTGLDAQGHSVWGKRIN